ncbi:MAG: hypothetical protein LBL37_02675 [Gracilibacteraceae bacterium]|nr:hypothetical protein [Gracilibacteraceae bacterium]
MRKGTLTAPERGVMESHVTITGKMLNRMAFSKNYSRVPEWAASHHELLNGGGYPNQLAGGAIPREVRLLTILDIFDALTARDRPYKPAMPTEKALSILGEMARDGQLDAEILALFTACEPWLIRDELTRAGAQTREVALNRKEPVTRAEPVSRETPVTREAPVSREEPMTREAPPARAETDG